MAHARRGREQSRGRAAFVLSGLPPSGATIVVPCMPLPPQPVDDPVMRRLVALIHAPLPNSAYRARIYLLEQLHVLEEEALATGAMPEILRAIRSTQAVIRRSDPVMGA